MQAEATSGEYSAVLLGDTLQCFASEDFNINKYGGKLKWAISFWVKINSLGDSMVYVFSTQRHVTLWEQASKDLQEEQQWNDMRGDERGHFCLYLTSMALDTGKYMLGFSFYPSSVGDGSSFPGTFDLYSGYVELPDMQPNEWHHVLVNMNFVEDDAWFCTYVDKVPYDYHRHSGMVNPGGMGDSCNGAMTPTDKFGIYADVDDEAIDVSIAGLATFQQKNISQDRREVYYKAGKAYLDELEAAEESEGVGMAMATGMGMD